MPNGDEQSASLSSPEDLKLTFEAGHIHLFDSVLRLDLQEPVQDVFLIGLLVRRPILRGKYKRIRTSPTQLLFQKLCKMFKYCLFCQSCHSQTLPTSDYYYRSMYVYSFVPASPPPARAPSPWASSPSAAPPPSTPPRIPSPVVPTTPRNREICKNWRQI